MTLSSRIRLTAILLMVFFCVACNGDRTPGESIITTNTDESYSILKSKAWKDYKKYWEKIDALNKANAADSLFSKIDAQEADLDSIFSNDTDLVNDLLMILRDRLSIKEKMLRDQRGRPPQPDWVGQLKRKTDRLTAECRVVERFADMGVTDPWIKASLLPDIRLYTQMVAQGIEDVRSHSSPDTAASDVQDLLENADAALKRARALLENLGM
jgi:hypothetical protein